MDKRVFGWGGVILMLMLNNNTYMLMHKKQDLPQYAFKEIIEQVPQASLLNYGFLDGGFYTVCDIVPECKYFCKLNIKLEESDIEQDNCIEQGAVDFVVTRGNELESSLYECIAEKEFEFEEKMWKYRLYALKELSM